MNVRVYVRVCARVCVLGWLKLRAMLFERHHMLHYLVIVTCNCYFVIDPFWLKYFALWYPVRYCNEYAIKS